VTSVKIGRPSVPALVHTEEVTGSNPVSPTFRPHSEQLGSTSASL
jgi:hypothetical protein